MESIKTITITLDEYESALHAQAILRYMEMLSESRDELRELKLHILAGISRKCIIAIKEAQDEQGAV